jgi:hypothetical protein
MLFVAVQHAECEPIVDIDALFAETERRLDIKRGTVAHLQGLSPSQLAQQLHGQGHPSLRRLIEMWFSPDPDGKRFVAEFFQVASETLGFADLDPVAHAMGQALISLGAAITKLRMAQPEPVHHHAQERRRA